VQSTSKREGAQLAAADLTPDWSPVKLIGFRFAAVYMVLYTGLEFVSQLYLPFTSDLLERWQQIKDAYLWGPIVRWMASHVFHVTPVGPYGPYRGWEVVNVACLIILATVVTAAWSYLDRRRREYVRLHEWFRVFLRFTLAAVLLDFGIEKVLLVQMGPSPLPVRVLVPLAMETPQRLLWTYMAAAPAYQAFAGLLETLGGVLLMLRRTALLGALIAFAAMLNVAVIDWAYHVDGPVIYATHMVVMALLLLIPDLRRLMDVLVGDRAVTAPLRPRLTTSAGVDRAFRVVGVLVLTWTVAHMFYLYAYGFPIANQFWNWKRPPFFGAYDVETFIRNGDSIPPLLSDVRRWRRMFVNDRANPYADADGQIQLMPDTLRAFFFQIDSTAGTLMMWRRGDTKNKNQWTYSQPDAQHLILTGTDFLLPDPQSPAGETPDSLRVVLRQIDLEDLPLFQPKHWFR
jgi:hypothetical protein